MVDGGHVSHHQNLDCINIEHCINNTSNTMFFICSNIIPNTY
jgi:hypothetical protein